MACQVAGFLVSEHVQESIWNIESIYFVIARQVAGNLWNIKSILYHGPAGGRVLSIRGHTGIYGIWLKYMQQRLNFRNMMTSQGGTFGNPFENPIRVPEKWNPFENPIRAPDKCNPFENPIRAPDKWNPFENPIKVPDKWNPFENPIKVPDKWNPFENPIRAPEKWKWNPFWKSHQR